MQLTIMPVDAQEMVPPLLSYAEPDSPLQIVAIDEDECFRDTLSNELEPRGFSVTTFADGPSVLEAIDYLAAADLIVLDWDHSSSPGLTLLHQLRRAGVAAPIVFLTRRSIASNECVALENGAIDFIDKSRGYAILAFRLKIARQKVPTAQRDKTFTLGELKLKTQVSRAFWAGTDLDLTVGEFKIVALLAANAGHHVTYRALYDVLHYRGFVAGCGESGYKTNVRSAIRRIRRKFEALDPHFDRIQNYTAFGYIWALDGE